MTDARQEYSLGGFGARLKAAREKLHLSQKEAATRLHLNPSIVEILESEHFEKAPPATFLRGYLRSYARLLKFSEDEIKTVLTQSGLETPTTTPVMPVLRVETMQMTDRHVQRISTGVIIGLFVFVGVWWGFHSSSINTNTLARSAQQVPAQPKVIQPAVQQPQPVTATVAPATLAPAQPIAQSVPTQPAVSPSSVQPNPVATQTATAPPALAGTRPVTNSDLPAFPAADPFATTIIPLRPGATIASTNDETPKKHTRHHKQDSRVSGFAMALPEPGL